MSEQVTTLRETSSVSTTWGAWQISAFLEWSCLAWACGFMLHHLHRVWPSCPTRLQDKGLNLLVSPREPWVTPSRANPSAPARTLGKGSGKMVLSKIPQMFPLCKGWMGSFSWQLFLAIFPQVFFPLKIHRSFWCFFLIIMCLESCL